MESKEFAPNDKASKGIELSYVASWVLSLSDTRVTVLDIAARGYIQNDSDIC